ncbi:helix-turn-helix transcriptional regulator [Novosphingobium aquimarinum]|uniref:helix-turn-helix transcriptional regulator n=1 Tax=Novosphingobium aquimarinum TaxID=2682494 RepID=UPI0012EB2347|nr:helix-turn-helix transcriptional regulator [Novosphingobium aquimarinum]
MPELNPQAEYADTSGVLAALFSSLLDKEPWSAFLDRLRHEAQASYATLILTPRTAEQPGMILTPGADPSVGADYASRLFTIDPFTGLPEGQVASFREFVSEEALQRNPAFRDFMSSLEVLGVDIDLPDRLQLRLRLTRAVHEPPFAREDIERLQQLVPHVRIALQLFERLSSVETEQQIYAGAVAQMAIGVVILNREGKAMRLNSQASAILAKSDGISLRNDTVMFENADLGRQLRARLADTQNTEPLTLRIDRPSGAGDLLLVISRAPGPDHVAAGVGPAAVLFLTDPTDTPPIAAEALRDLLGLTPGEAEVAARLADGLSLAEVADRLGISPNTVRAHLRSIFGKTGVKRQSQLIQLVHHSLPGLVHSVS